MIKNTNSSNPNSSSKANEGGSEKRSKHLSQKSRQEENGEFRNKQKVRQSSKKAEKNNSNTTQSDHYLYENNSNLPASQILHRKINTSTSQQSQPSQMSYSTQFPSITEIAQQTAHKMSNNNSSNTATTTTTTTTTLPSLKDNSYLTHNDSPSQEPQRSVSPDKQDIKYDLEDQENNPNIANCHPNQCQNSSKSNPMSFLDSSNNMNHQGYAQHSNHANSNANINQNGHNQILHQQNHQLNCNNNNNNHRSDKNPNNKSSSKQRYMSNKSKKLEYKPGQMNLKNQESLSCKASNSSSTLLSSASKSCSNNRGMRNLSNLLKSLKFSPLLIHQHQVTQSLLTLPFELHFLICSYLSPKDVYLRLAFVNQYFYKMNKDTRLWNYMQRFQSFSINDKYQKNLPVVERRSKGRLFSAVSRLNGQQFMIRNVNIMISNAGQDDGVPTSILRELSFLHTLNHKNITSIHEVDIKNVVVQIVSERQEYNLKEYIKQYSKQVSDDKGVTRPQYKIPLIQVKKIAYQILEGFNYLHHQGIMHRNMKIDNVLIHNDIVKISDFGLARLVTIPHIPYTPEDPKERERSGREARRLWYRAPELLLRKSIYTFEIDMWSFGCLLAEIVLNEPLFAGDSEIEQLFKIFKFIGSPDAETLMTMCDNPDYQQTFPKWKNINLSHICEPNLSEEFKQLKTIMIPNRQNGFQKLKNLGTALGMDGMKLLNSLLQLNPYKRISALEALNHSFFDEIRQLKTIIEIPAQISQNLEQINLDLVQNKENINQMNKVPSQMNENCQELGKNGLELGKNDQCCRQVIPSCYFQFSLPYCHLSKIYQTMVATEQKDSIFNKDYMKNQTVITENMRIILIDWLIDVSVHFETQDETLHYCISYIDRVLSVMNIERQKLQLIGVSCMKLADVFNERSREYYKQENAMEYAYITAEEYNASQLIAMEKKILKKLSFQLNTPNTMYFLKIICTLFDTDSQVSVIAMFLADLLLMSYEALKYNPSLLASCCVFLSFITNERELPSEEKIKEVRYLFDHYSLDEFNEAVEFVRKFWHYYRSDPTTLNFESVYNKYAIVYGLEARLINAPQIGKSQLNKWIYTQQFPIKA